MTHPEDVPVLQQHRCAQRGFWFGSVLLDHQRGPLAFHHGQFVLLFSRIAGRSND